MHSRTKIFLIIIAVAIIAIAARFILKSDKKEDPKAKGNYAIGLTAAIEGIVVKPGEIDQNIEVSGTVIPYDETILQSEVAGRVIQLFLPEGQTVTKGTLLVKLFDGDLRAQLNKLQVQLKIAEATEKRQKELLTVSGISQQDYDLSELQVNTLHADVELIKVQISKTEIRAPFSGKIGLKKISDGAYLAPSTVIATIRSENNLKLDFSVPEKYSSAIKTGKNVTFTIDGSDKEYTATINATEQNIESNTRNLNIRALIKNSAGLLPGNFAKINLVLDTRYNSLVIPTKAVIPQARDKKVIVSRNGKAVFVKIKTGVRQADGIEVLDGLQPGDTVVTTGVLFVKPDSPLKFSKIN